MAIATVGLDISKQAFQVHAADSAGCAVLRKRLNQAAEFFANLPPCLIGVGGLRWAKLDALSTH